MNISIIQRRIGEIRKLEQEIKIGKDTIKQALEEDARYVEAHKAAKETSNKRKQIKDEILNQAENQQFEEDIEVNTAELKTLKEILTTELVEYYQKVGKDEIEDDSGTPVKFKFSTKLISKNYTE